MLTNQTFPTINRQQLYDLAFMSGNVFSLLVVSWTGGDYSQVDTDYHLNIGPKGQVYLTCDNLFENKPHIRTDTRGTVGIALDCGKDTPYFEKIYKQEDFGPYPPTQEQLISLGLVLAVLCKAFKLTPEHTHVRTQWEVAFFNSYSPMSKDPHPRFDLIALPYYEKLKKFYSIFGCCYLRKLVKHQIALLN